jgi:hypothetical protein
MVDSSMVNQTMVKSMVTGQWSMVNNAIVNGQSNNGQINGQ